jgi:uncharacterized membrane protein YqjE
MASEPPLGLVRSIRALTGTLIQIIETRLAILSTDVEETIAYLTRTLFAAALAALFFFLAVLMLALLVVAAFWDTHRLLALSVVAAASLSASAGAGWVIAHGARTHLRFLATSLSELKRDRAALSEGEA